MRVLLLMRGAPGCGKSTWIEQNGLKPYTLSADDLRLMFNTVKLTDDGFCIPQNTESLVWNELYDILEKRMSKGYFTVIDATHANPTHCNQYKTLADKYRYRIYVKTIDVSLDTLLQRNDTRPVFKKVPKPDIERKYGLIKHAKLNKSFIQIDTLEDILYNDICASKTWNASIPNQNNAMGYKKVVIIPDIHGCLNTLKSAIGDTIDDIRVLHVFLGDLFERGPHNYDTLKYMMNLATKDNVTLVEGNHDLLLHEWANDLPSKPGKGFEHFVKEIEVGTNNDGITLDNFKKQVRVFTRKLRQVFIFKMSDESTPYFCNHGGLTHIPRNLALVATTELLRGVGDYNYDVAGIYKSNESRQYIQVCGHRPQNTNEWFIGLQTYVEKGEDLRTLEVTKDGHQVVTHPNLDVVKEEVSKDTVSTDINVPKIYNSNKGIIEAIISTGYANVEHKGDDLRAIRFREEVFNKRIYNQDTIKPRGLYYRADTYDIVARGYNKMFNYNDKLGYTDSKTLAKTLVFPVTAIEKHNGYLGLLSVDNGELFLATKHSVSPSFELYTTFKETFDACFNHLSVNEQQEFIDIITSHNVTLTFEVIHPIDPHIVDYNDIKRLYLLDAIPNTLVGVKHHIDPVVSDEVLALLKPYVDKMEGMEITMRITTFNDMDKLREWLKLVNTSSINTEGFIIRDSIGFMFKYKINWYKDWKRKRSLFYLYVRSVKHNHIFDYSRCVNLSDMEFIHWVSETIPDNELSQYDIVKLRNMYLK